MIAGYFLENAPILCVSNNTGEGIPKFKEVLDNLIEQTPPRQANIVW